MTRSIYVPLPGPARVALYQLAEREWRHPKEQASKLLVEALRQAGALTDWDLADGLADEGARLSADSGEESSRSPHVRTD